MSLWSLPLSFFAAVHPRHGIVWTDGQAIFLAGIKIHEGQLLPTTAKKLSQFEYAFLSSQYYEKKKLIRTWQHWDQGGGWDCFLTSCVFRCVFYGKLINAASLNATGRSKKLNKVFPVWSDPKSAKHQTKGWCGGAR